MSSTDIDKPLPSDGGSGGSGSGPSGGGGSSLSPGGGGQGQPNVTLTVRMIMSGKEVGSIIGKGGEIINGIRDIVARWLQPDFKIVCVWPFGLLDYGAPTPSTLAQSKERKGSNFAIWQP